MQGNNQTIPDFIQRTDYLADRLRLNLSEIPQKIGISKAMLYAYRAGQSRITNKVWLKLDSAERAAGIVPPGETGNAGSSADPKQSPASPGEKLPVQEDPFSIQSLMDAILIHHASFTLAELESRMTAASAWPATPADRHLTPAQLWQKYAPA